jgi:uncharacterized protein YcbK (DUF882 family)
MTKKSKILIISGGTLLILSLFAFNYRKQIKEFIMKYFTMSELVKTSTGLPNIPNETQKANLTRLVEKILDPARTLLGSAITVTSGFRTLAVNARVGGATNSQHLTGEACDVTCSDNLKLFNIIKTLPFDQLIWEKGTSAPQWIHVSYREGANRNQVLRYDGSNYYAMT